MLQDDQLENFLARGAAPLPKPKRKGFVCREGAAICYSTYGSGIPVLFLHGGLGHSGNWGYQVPVLVKNGYEVVLVDSRGHGRSTRDSRPFSYALMSEDVLAVVDELQIDKIALVGWSDGACTALVLASKAPHRVRGVFFFACNMDPSGVKPFEETKVLARCFERHKIDYAELSKTPNEFDALVADLSKMQRSQPNHSAEKLAKISVPVTIAQGEDDEFILLSHAKYLAETIPGAEFHLLREVSHFAPLQRPALFSGEVLQFLKTISFR